MQHLGNCKIVFSSSDFISSSGALTVTSTPAILRCTVGDQGKIPGYFAPSCWNTLTPETSESCICTITQCFSIDCLCSYWDTAQDPNKTELAHPGKLPGNNRFTHQNYNKAQTFESQTRSVRPLGIFHYPEDKHPVLIKIIQRFKWCSFFCSNHMCQTWEMSFSTQDISVV